MNKLLYIFHVTIISALLTSCADKTPGLWSAQATPTHPSQPAPTITLTLQPTISPSPSITPLMVIPMPGTQTPEIGSTPVLQTPDPKLTTKPATATLPPVNTSGVPMDQYWTQGGDTLNILSKRFSLSPDQFIANINLPLPDQLIPVNTLLLVPKPAPDSKFTSSERTIPDSEVAFGPSSINFSSQDYVVSKGGFLSTYRVYTVFAGWLTGYQAVDSISQDNSLSPRILLAIIEYESHWVLGQPTNLAQEDYPLGYIDFSYRGLFRQLMWASGALSDGYYRWRSGDLHEIKFKDGSKLRLSPFLNAGSVAVQYYFAQNHTRAEWEQAMSPNGFPALYARMFGPTLQRAEAFEPTIPDGLTQPALTLPFELGKLWALTSGPHSAWEKQGGALAALDLAPGSMESGCVLSDAWVVAPAAGKVVRVGQGEVIFDLDMDGYEQTGWDILFMHIRNDEKAQLGQVLQPGDHIGHPSCEGGVATGTHLHIARKYNGEWILADGPLAFNMDGWIAHNGSLPEKGTMTRNGQTVTACTCSSKETNLIRGQ